MTAFPSLLPPAVPLLAPDLYEGASFLSERLGVDRLLIVSTDGRPLVTFVRTRLGARLEKPAPRFHGPAANVPLLRFARMHFLRIASRAHRKASR